MTAVACRLSLDEELEAGFVTLAGGLAMLADKAEVGVSLVLLGGLVVLLSEKTELRGTGA
ncbi:hypothetical protein PM022_19275 [Halorubrum ezzemoulense]|uniref:hypothetical protein n=1 Tax=Halorubrum ezzemoulense TaxID=337243 RepID=UPI0023302D1F|nr:hypothetical protein [Halorubrum ezzemoulense]MDB2276621.1 hypothetical protein [Halorubrum ezzemoulense]